ncbi:uncharacterized protein SCHCODRAFT_02286082 [Schizophyllum commune H4-8]|uniref:uncharacterized protein n=1 Tax=Schizophyllum commune (strain H4-8 / FGSC 9210) TaxID=578458 RepID=UPI00215F1D00|nr:uncharacterized protein SCHCODRAFT_02286082 [Schizophyllum commune H4-8]KAI5892203.1 hypothetical protein SCHCODRAFT_02286082 [Schizophyllum commune H4-8]
MTRMLRLVAEPCTMIAWQAGLVPAALLTPAQHSLLLLYYQCACVGRATSLSLPWHSQCNTVRAGAVRDTASYKARLGALGNPACAHRTLAICGDPRL